MSRTTETSHKEWHERCKCKFRQMAVFVVINKVGMMINAGVNAKNRLL